VQTVREETAVETVIL